MIGILKKNSCIKKLNQSFFNDKVSFKIASFKSNLDLIISKLSACSLLDVIKKASCVLEEKVKIQTQLEAESNPMTPSSELTVESITSYFVKSARNANDATNKIREKVLKVLCSPPQEYLEDSVYGGQWQIVYRAWNNALKLLADKTGIPHYTRTSIIVKGGRSYNYDADVQYYDGDILVANRKIEFKNGGKTINDLPQFLSLPAKISLFEETYDTFWYTHYLDRYISCDTELTLPKPSLEEYLKRVSSNDYYILPFFAQMKSRDEFFKKEKKAAVNASITAYLTMYGHMINMEAFSEKVKTTQTDKFYLLWHDEMFYLDKLEETEMTDMVFHRIKNGNVLQVKAGNTIYGLLLRWRNRKGVLNPAWQISMARK